MTGSTPALAVMRARGRQQKTFAEAAGYTAPHVSRVLHGQVPASTAFRAKLAAFLDVPEGELFTAEEVAAGAADLIARTRVARGLPATVEDLAVLARVASAVRAGMVPE